MNNLSTYLEDAGVSQRQFAARVGVDPSIVSRLRKKLISPSLDLAFKIERATGGAVPMSSWLEEKAS